VRVLGKGQWRARLAPLSREAQGAIERWLRKRSQVGGVDVASIFTAFAPYATRPLGKAITRHTVWSRLQRYGTQVGLPRLSPHDLRRFVATEVAKKFGLHAAQLTMEHVSSTTTSTHYLMDQLEGVPTAPTTRREAEQGELGIHMPPPRGEAARR
jgi:integrase